MDSLSQTTTVLTLDLPNRIDERLRRALRAQKRTARDVTLEALQLWLDRYEATAGKPAEEQAAESLTPASGLTTRR